MWCRHSTKSPHAADTPANKQKFFLFEYWIFRQTVELVKNPSTVDHHKSHIITKSHLYDTSTIQAPLSVFTQVDVNLDRFRRKALGHSQKYVYTYICVCICELTSTWVKTPLLFKHQNLGFLPDSLWHTHVDHHKWVSTSTWVKTPLLFKRQNFVTQLIRHWITALKVLSKKM